VLLIRCLLDDSRLQFLDALADLIDHRKIVVDDRVEQGVEEDTDAAFDLGAAATEACGDLFDLLDRLAVEGQQLRPVVS